MTRHGQIDDVSCHIGQYANQSISEELEQKNFLRRGTKQACDDCGSHDIFNLFLFIFGNHVLTSSVLMPPPILVPLIRFS